MAVDNRALVVELLARDKMSKPVKRVQSSIIRFVGAVSAALAAVKTISFPVQEALDFDRAMRDVQKTTGFTDGQIRTLSSSLNTLATNLAVSQQELADIAAVGGQLGLGSFGVDAIRAFTESVARAKVTLQLTAEQASSLGAQLLNIFSLDISNIENVFSEVNALTNTSVANARDLGDVMKRVGSVAGLSVKQTGALAAYLADLGVSTEVAGTSLTKFFTNMSTKADKFAETMSISTQDWVDLLETNAVTALKEALTSIESLDSVAKASAIKELFGGGRQFSTASKLITGVNDDFARLNELLSTANQAYDEGTSSIREYENILKSVKEQFNLVANSIRSVAIEIGTSLLPDLDTLAKSLQRFFTQGGGKDFFLELGVSLKSLVRYLEDLVTGVVNSDVAWGALIDNIVTLVKVIGVFIGLEIGLHLANMAVNAFKFGKVLSESFKGIGDGVKDFLRIKKVSKETATSEVADSEKVVRAKEAEIAAIRKVREETLQSIRTSKLARDKTGAEQAKANASIASLGAGDKKIALGLLKKEVELRTRNLATIAKEREAEARSWSIRKKIFADAIASSRKGSAQYVAATARMSAATKAHQKRLRSLSNRQARNTALLREYSAILTKTAASIDIANAAMLRQAGVSNRIALSFGRVITVLPRAAGAITLFAKGVTTAGKALKGLYTLLGGWVGILLEIATSVFIFWDDIVGAFSDGTKAVSEAALRAARQSRRELEQLRSDAIAAFEAFDITKAEKASAALSGALDKGDLEGFSIAAQRAATELANLSKASEGADASTQDLDKSISLSGGRLAQYRTELAEVQRQLDKPIGRKAVEALNNGVDIGHDKTGLLKKYKSLLSQKQELINKINAADKSIKVQRDVLDAFATRKADIERSAHSLAVMLVAQKGVTKESLAALKVRKKINKTEEDLLKINRKIEQTVISLDKAKSDKNKSDITSLSNELVDLQGQAVTAREKISDLYNTEYKDNVSKLTKAQLKPLKALGKLSSSTIGTLISQFDRLSKTGAISTQARFNDELRAQVIVASDAIAKNEQLLKVYRDYTKPIRDVVSAIKGMFDNISKSVNSAKKEVQGLTSSLESLLRSRKQERDLNAANKKIDKAQTEEEKRINDRFDKLIERKKSSSDYYAKIAEESAKKEAEALINAEKEVAKRRNRPVDSAAISEIEAARDKKIREIQAQAAVGTKSYLDQVKKRRERELELVRTLNDSKKAEVKVKVIRESLSSANKKLVDSMKDLSNIQERLNKLNSSGALKTEKGQKELVKLKTSFDNTKEAITANRKETEKYIKELSNISDTKPRFPGDLKGTPIVNDQEITKAYTSIGDAMQSYATKTQDIITAFNDAGKVVTTSLDSQEAAFANAAKTARDPLKGITAEMGDDAQKVALSFLSAMRSSYTQLGEEWGSLMQRMANDPNLKKISDLVANPDRIQKATDAALGGAQPSDIAAKGVLDKAKTRDQKAGNDTANIAETLLKSLQNIDFSKSKEETQKSIQDALKNLKKAKVPTELDIAPVDGKQIKSDINNGKPIEVGVKFVPVNDLAGLADRGSAPSARKNARGGHIRGPGTGTSDSILSWLSNGEYVLKAAAVRKYGVNLLNYMNSLAIPKGAIPAFAGGGAVSTIAENHQSKTPVVIQLPSGSTHTLEGSDQEVTRLKREAIIEAIKRGDVR